MAKRQAADQVVSAITEAVLKDESSAAGKYSDILKATKATIEAFQEIRRAQDRSPAPIDFRDAMRTEASMLRAAIDSAGSMAMLVDHALQADKMELPFREHILKRAAWLEELADHIVVAPGGGRSDPDQWWAIYATAAIVRSVTEPAVGATRNETLKQFGVEKFLNVGSLVYEALTGIPPKNRNGSTESHPLLGTLKRWRKGQDDMSSTIIVAGGTPNERQPN